MNSLVRVLWMRRDKLWENGLMWNQMTQCTLLHGLTRESLSGSALGALGGWNTHWDMCLNVKKPYGRVFATFLSFECLYVCTFLLLNISMSLNFGMQLLHC